LQSYYLDLSTLLQIMSRQKRSGTLTIEHIHLPNVRGQVSVSVEIEQGVIRSCQITQKRTLIAAGQPAIQVLLPLQALEWHWSPLLSSKGTQGDAPAPSTVAAEQSIQLSPSKREPVFIPQQTVLAQDTRVLKQLSRQHRRVLSLIDGNRTPAQIADLLTISIADFSHYVRDLEHWGLIFFSSIGRS
jgi:hypothetical protein